MALLKFLKGNYANLNNAAINEGQILVCGDTGELFVDVAADKRVKIGDFITVANLAALEALDATAVPTSRLYYVEDGNILARSNGTSWVQVNKQPTIAELKVQLGLGTLAYKSEVAEGDLNTDLVAKINASTAANHSHENKGVLDGITSDKVTAWDSAEQNAKDYADGLNTAMNGRVEALEAIDHEHANKALLDTYTQTEANLADAVAKKHSHTFNETELNKIVEGDVAKWNAVVADHLTSADKTTLENAIKEAKKAGTDANTNIEAYKVTNDARVLAVEEDIAEIVDGENGILAQAKSYVDGKDSAMNTRVTALETAAPTYALKTEVEAVDAKFADYNTTTVQKGIDDAQDAEIAKKVNKTDYEADKATFATKTDIAKLEGVSEGANKVEASETNGNIKIDGVETTVYTHPVKHQIADIEGLQDVLDGKQSGGDYAAEEHTHTKSEITDFAHTHVSSEITDLDATIKGYDYATKTELGDVDAKFANYKTAADQKVIDDEQDRRLGVLEGASATHATKDELAGVDAKFADYTKTADLPTDLGDFTNNAGYAKTVDVNTELDKKADKSVVDAMYTNSQIDGFITTEKERAEGIEAGLRTDVDAIKADYLTSTDKTALQEQITANANAITVLTDGIDPDKIDGLTDLVNWANEHAPEVESIKEDIEANTKAISDHETLAAETYETKTDASAKLTEAKGYTDTEVAKDRERLTALETVKDDYKTADATLKSELQAEIDSDVKVVSDALDTAKTELSAAIEAAKTDASNKDTVVLAEAQAYTDDVIAAAATDVQTKIDSLANGAVATNTADIATLFEMMTWGEFPTGPVAE